VLELDDDETLLLVQYLLTIRLSNQQPHQYIIMSLLGSIFGSKDEKKEEVSGLFQKSADLPERPHHDPILVKRRAKKDSVVEESDKKKKRRQNREEKKKVATAEGTNDEKEEVVDDENGDKQEGDEKRTVFVGNLPLATTTRKSLMALFKDCGPIESTRIRSVPVTGIKLPPNRKGDQNLMRKVSANTSQVDEQLKNTVQGYVVFKSKDSVAAALEKNNTKVQGGWRIRVDKSSPTVDPSRSVFLGNLPYGAEENSLQAHFMKGCDLELGDVEGVRIVRDKDTFQCKGFGYVLFKERSMVPLALKLHETKYMKKQIRVQVCGKRFKNNKTAAPKPAYEKSQGDEKVSIGAFRRILGTQTKEALSSKRKRGEKKKTTQVAAKKSTSGLSKRATLDKKVDQRVRKLQKRATKGMGKTRQK
jgi:nucleolar protein 12